MISSHVLYHKWLNELIYRWPEQNKARLKAFAWLLTGLFLSGHVHLSKIARKLPGKAHNKSKERKLSRLLNNLKLPVRLLYKPIAERLLAEAAQNGQPIRLMIDGSKVGNGHQLLMIALAYRRRSFPLIWTWRKGVKGHSPVYAQIALFLAVRLLIPQTATVIVTGDSEFGSCLLMQRFEKWGWLYALRQKGRYLFSQSKDQQWQRCDTVCARGPITLVHRHHVDTEAPTSLQSADPLENELQ